MQESAWPGYEEIPLVEALNGTIKPDNIPEGIIIIFVCKALIRTPISKPDLSQRIVILLKLEIDCSAASGLFSLGHLDECLAIANTKGRNGQEGDSPMSHPIPL